MGFSTAAKVGVITLLGIFVVGIMILWKTEIFMVRKGYDLVATFENVEGLTEGSEVRFRGSKVGKVLHIDPGPYDIKVYSVIDSRIKIPADSTLRVSYDGIVGLKFLEVRPGTAEALYSSPSELKGARTSAIVDFIDIGSKNLIETKTILETVRKLMENPALQKAFTDTVFTAQKTAFEAENLTRELSLATKGIASITADPKFQENIKGTISETAKTLSSANKFFDSSSKLNLRASGGVDLGSRTNAVRGDIDIIQNEKAYYRFGIGEGPTRQMSVLDFILTSKMRDDFGYRLGVINSQLGGGVIINPSNKTSFLADIYDINNPRPNWPKIRLSYEYQIQDYMDMLIQGDDLLNGSNSNVTFGIRVKPINERLF